MSIIKKSSGNSFLPINKTDMDHRGWESCEFIIITGDAYVDHPSFGAAIIGRLLENEGYRTGIIAQPDWKTPESFTVLGKPDYAFLITSGNLDSMVNHYSSMKRPRRTDAYSPGGKTGLRPDRALIAYTAAVKQVWKGVPVVLGGIEASLRRLSHYDYWSNKLRRSVLVDSKADLLIYGMGENPVVETARRLAGNEDIKSIRDIRGTVYRLTGREAEDGVSDTVMLPSFADLNLRPELFGDSYVLRSSNNNPFTAGALAEPTDGQLVVQNPPAFPLSESEMDRLYSLPYTRTAHPVYSGAGGIPALTEVEFSITANRGCYGSCSFCSLAFHQGRVIQARSSESIIGEAQQMTQSPGFKGIIHDVGGPTANFYHPACEKQRTNGGCADRECLFPEPCPKIDSDHRNYLELLRKLRSLPGVKKVFIRSGLRFDYLMSAVNAEKKAGGKKITGGTEFLEELCRHHVSGQLKTAPEHVSDRVLKLMKKPSNRVYQQFVQAFEDMNRKLNKKQYIIPYLISGHPGSDLNDAIELALYLKRQGFIPDQVQDFYPTPASLSTCIYFTGIDPYTKIKVYSAKTPEEKAMQRALLHFHKHENRNLVIRALKKAGRMDLVGNGKNCLIR